ncbi:hypothetical protein [Synechocystis sp. LKSZ1]|uniref:hypothetical protein n=1 Tax=Synechocystis sp. LKSZ1 TaxID=3144951 RepID=UPI00336BE964
MFAVFERPQVHPDELPISRLDVALGHHSFWSAWEGAGTWEEERYTQAQRILAELMNGFLPAPEAPISNQAMEVYNRLCQRYLAPAIYRGDFPTEF